MSRVLEQKLKGESMDILGRTTDTGWTVAAIDAEGYAVILERAGEERLALTSELSLIPQELPCKNTDVIYLDGAAWSVLGGEAA